MPRPGWEDNIRMNLNEIGVNTRNWFGSAQDRNHWIAFVKSVFKHQVP